MPTRSEHPLPASLLEAWTTRRGVFRAGMAGLPALYDLPIPRLAPSERIALWPEGAPGGEAVSVRQAEILRSPDSPPDDIAYVHVTDPFLLAFPAPQGAARALLLIPGGGYQRIALGSDIGALASAFHLFGFHVYVLVHRLPADGWAAGPDAPLQDGLRALEIIAARQPEVQSTSPSVIGFSAGGHLAARLSTAGMVQRQALGIRRAPPVPSAALCFPVIATTGADAHEGSVRQLLGADATAAQALSADGRAFVSSQAPPTIICHAADDTVVPASNSLKYFAALEEAGVRRALHIFSRGGHSLGLKAENGAYAPWVGHVGDWFHGKG